MDMICHETKGMNAKTEPGCPLLQQEIEAIPVVIAEENRLTAIATKHNVIEPARDMNTGFTCHE
jgi:hypothetical protein